MNDFYQGQPPFGGSQPPFGGNSGYDPFHDDDNNYSSGPLFGGGQPPFGGGMQPPFSPMPPQPPKKKFPLLKVLLIAGGIILLIVAVLVTVLLVRPDSSNHDIGAEPETIQTPAPEVVQIPEPETTQTPAPEVVQIPEPETTQTPAPEVVQIPETEFIQVPENKSLQYYYYEQLSPSEQQCYDTLLTGISRMDESVEVTINSDRLGEIINFIGYDHPELFWWGRQEPDGMYFYSTSTYDYESFKVIFDYNCSTDEKERRQVEIESAARTALEYIKNGNSEYEYAKNAFTYLANKIDYVTGAQDNQNIYSSMVLDKTVCTGYTKAFQYLLQKMGMEVIYVSGYPENNNGERESHAWDIIKLDGEYYLVDVTWGDPIHNGSSASQNTDPPGYTCEYGYLCFSERFRPEQPEQNNVPAATGTKYNHYVMKNRYYTSYTSIESDMREDYLNGQAYWEGQFENQADFEACLRDMENSRYISLGSEVLNRQDYTMYYNYNKVLHVVRCWFI